MGPIQSSINQLFLSSIGAAWAIGHGVKGLKKPVKTGIEKTETPAKPEVSAQTNSSMGNIAKIGRNYSNTGMRSYMAAARSVESGNDAIAQKATSHFDPITVRLEEVNKAVKGFVEVDKEDKK